MFCSMNMPTHASLCSFEIYSASRVLAEEVNLNAWTAALHCESWDHNRKHVSKGRMDNEPVNRMNLYTR